MKRLLIRGIAAIVTAVLTWMTLPVLNRDFTSGLMLSLLFAGVVMIASKKEKAILSSIIVIATSGMLLLGMFTSSTMYEMAIKRQMLATQAVEFDATVDMSDWIVLNASDAIQCGEQLISEDPSLGAVYEISKAYGTLSIVDGAPNWLLPLEQSDRKYETVPGYIKVNAVTGKTVFVQKQLKHSSPLALEMILSELFAHSIRL